MGQRVYEVDANNRIVREISCEAPVNGMDIQLSIDLDLQQYAERLLQTQLRLQARSSRRPTPGRRSRTAQRRPAGPDPAASAAACTYKAPAGSVIVMNHQTGQIVAMASYPTFDNRWFNAGIDGDKFDQIFPRRSRSADPTPTGRS